MSADPYQIAATSLKEIIDAEFAPESIIAIHDDLHESLGSTRVSVGISPDYETPSPGNAVTNEFYLTVQFFDLWDPQIDPEQTVNPFRITEKANRFKEAVREHQRVTPGSGEVWFFSVTRVAYPRDPTGNKTRFVATVKVYGNNSSLVETAA